MFSSPDGGKDHGRWERPWTPGKEPGVNTSFGLAAQRVHSSTTATSQIRNDTVRVVREERRMNSSPDPTRQDNDPSDGYGPSETPRSSQGDQVDSCFTCSTCGKSWPSNRSRASHQVHCRKAQRENQRSNASRPDLRQ